MGKRIGWALAGLVVILSWAAFANPGSLTVAQAGPVGEVAELKDANEVRVLFSEPMVTLGGSPTRVAPSSASRPRFGERPAGRHAAPDLHTDSATPLRYALRGDDRRERGVGRRAQARQTFTFAFATPSVRLKGVEWQRKTGRYDAPVLLYLRFNQPVSPRP